MVFENSRNISTLSTDTATPPTSDTSEATPTFTAISVVLALVTGAGILVTTSKRKK